MEPIDAKVKEAWRDSRVANPTGWTLYPLQTLADAYVHERAMREKVETWLEVYFDRMGALITSDTRLQKTDADWEAKVRKELEGENG